MTPVAIQSRGSPSTCSRLARRSTRRSIPTTASARRAILLRTTRTAASSITLGRRRERREIPTARDDGRRVHRGARRRDQRPHAHAPHLARGLRDRGLDLAGALLDRRRPRNGRGADPRHPRRARLLGVVDPTRRRLRQPDPDRAEPRAGRDGAAARGLSRPRARRRHGRRARAAGRGGAAVSLLEGRRLSKHFGGLQALSDVDFEIVPGEIVGLAGKALASPQSLTIVELRRLELARALATGARLLLLDEINTGLTPSEIVQAIRLIQRVRDRGATILMVEHLVRLIMSVCDRIVVLDFGRKIAGLAVPVVATLGVALVPEGRELFPHMTVYENLRLGGRRAGRSVAARLERVYTLFPRLAERARQLAVTLSGGEQQMLAIGRALMSEPHLVLLDEPSTGLAPLVVEHLFQVVRQLGAEGVTTLLVEQNAHLALEVSDRAYVLERRRVILEGSAATLLHHPQVQTAYLGHEA